MEAHRVVEVEAHELLSVGKDHLGEVSEVLHLFPVELQHLHTRDTQLVSFPPLLFQQGTPLLVLASASWHMRQSYISWYMRQFLLIYREVAPKDQEASLVVVLGLSEPLFKGFPKILKGCAFYLHIEEVLVAERCLTCQHLGQYHNLQPIPAISLHKPV